MIKEPHWRVEFSTAAIKKFTKLDKPTQKKIEQFIDNKLNKARDPTVFGKKLRGPLSPFYKFRVGDYRLIARVIDSLLVIEIITIGHRKEIYSHITR